MRMHAVIGQHRTHSGCSACPVSHVVQHAVDLLVPSVVPTHLTAKRKREALPESCTFLWKGGWGEGGGTEWGRV